MHKDFFIAISPKNIFREDLDKLGLADSWIQYGTLIGDMMNSPARAGIAQLIMSVYRCLFPEGRAITIEDMAELHKLLGGYFSEGMLTDSNFQGGRAVIGIILAAGLDDLAVTCFGLMKAHAKYFKEQPAPDTRFHDLLWIMTRRTQSEDFSEKHATSLIKAWAVVVGLMGGKVYYEIKGFNIHPYHKAAVLIACRNTEMKNWRSLVYFDAQILGEGQVAENIPAALEGKEDAKEFICNTPLFKRGIEATNFITKAVPLSD